MTNFINSINKFKDQLTILPKDRKANSSLNRRTQELARGIILNADMDTTLIHLPEVKNLRELGVKEKFIGSLFMHCVRNPLNHSLKIDKKQYNLPRSLIITPERKMYALLTSTKTKGDEILGEGRFKQVKHCLDLEPGKK